MNVASIGTPTTGVVPLIMWSLERRTLTTGATRILVSATL